MATRRTFEALASALHDLPDETFDPTVPNPAARTRARQSRLATASAVADALCAESDSFDPMVFVEQVMGAKPDPRTVAKFSTRLALRIGVKVA